MKQPVMGLSLMGFAKNPPKEEHKVRSIVHQGFGCRAAEGPRENSVKRKEDVVPSGNGFSASENLPRSLK